MSNIPRRSRLFLFVPLIVSRPPFRLASMRAMAAQFDLTSPLLSQYVSTVLTRDGGHSWVVHNQQWFAPSFCSQVRLVRLSPGRRIPPPSNRNPLDKPHPSLSRNRRRRPPLRKRMIPSQKPRAKRRPKKPPPQKEKSLRKTTSPE